MAIFSKTPPTAKAISFANDNTAPVSKTVVGAEFDRTVPASKAPKGIVSVRSSSDQPLQTLTPATDIANALFHCVLQVSDLVLLAREGDESWGGRGSKAMNGVYRVTDIGAYNITLARDECANTEQKLVDMVVRVEAGVDAGKLFHLTTQAPFVLDVFPLHFEQVVAGTRELGASGFSKTPPATRTIS